MITVTIILLALLYAFALAVPFFVKPLKYKFPAWVFAWCFAWYCTFVTYVPPESHVGIAWDYYSGETRLVRGGFNIIGAATFVAKVDRRPQRVCVTSTSRSYQCKLVQFVSEEYEKFLVTEGFYYYWWANRISFNGSYDEEYRGIRDLLRGYAFGTKQYPFVKIITVYED